MWDAPRRLEDAERPAEHSVTVGAHKDTGLCNQGKKLTLQLTARNELVPPRHALAAYPVLNTALLRCNLGVRRFEPRM